MESTSNIKLGSISRSKSEANFYLILLVSFFILGAIGILNHEMWRDEFEAWLLARDSASIPALLSNLKYTGHPALWYVSLHLITRFIRNPLAMQVFHLILATGFIYIFLDYSPFTRLQKTLFCLGYFPLFEYTIISRNYGAGLIFLFAFCVLYPSRYRSYLPLAITLALLSHLNAYGLIIGFALVITLILDAWLNRDDRKNLYGKRWTIVASSIVYLFGLITSILQIIPPSDAAYRGDLLSVYEGDLIDIQAEDLNNTAFHIRRLARAIASVWRAYVPIPDISDYHFHESNIVYFFTNNSADGQIDAVNFGDIFTFLASLVFLLLSVIIFYRKPIILFLYCLGNGAIIAFIYLIRVPSIRQSGYLFILLLICFWLSTYYSESFFWQGFGKKATDWLVKHKSKLLTILLCLHFLGGMYAYGRDLIHPFSASKNVANYIQNNNLEQLTIVGSEDARVTPLSALLDQEIYYPESEEFGTFAVWTPGKKKENKNVTHQEILAQTRDLITSRDREILLVLDKELESQTPALNIKPISKFESSIVADEVYHLYLVKSADAS